MVLPFATERFWGLNIIRAWDRGVADYNAPIIAPGFLPSSQDIHSLWRAIIRALPASDIVMLDKMPAHISGTENPLLKVRGVRLSFNARHHLLLGNGRALQRGSAFDPSMVRSLERKRRKLKNKGNLAFQLRSGPEGRGDLEQILLWRRQRFCAANEEAKVAAIGDFYKALCLDPTIARVGALTLDGRLIAGCFGTATGGTFQLLAMGFDDTYKNWSPGLLAVEHAIAAVQESGQQVFDFTIGTGAYKFDFGANAEPLYELFIPRTMKGFAAVLLRRIHVAWQRRKRRRAETAFGIQPTGRIVQPI